MTITIQSNGGTGPVIGEELRARTPSPWVAPAQSEPQPAVGDDVLMKAQRYSKQTGEKTAQRIALLGLLLAELEAVDFDDIALLLDVKTKPLQKMMHGEQQVPSGREARWEALAEVLHNLHRVLRASATGRWLHTSIPDLEGRTPLEAISRGQISRVVALTRSYLDPSFS